MGARRALHVSAHPDDEAVGCPASLITLTEQEWKVDNLLATLGRPEQEERRLQEARGAASELDIALYIVPKDLRRAPGQQFEDRLVEYLLAHFADRAFDLLISPTLHDVHPRHEAVGRACARFAQKRSVTWWTYAIWGDLSFPTLYLPYDERLMQRVTALLSHYDGELARNNYHTLVRGRASASTVLGSERVFGFGCAPASTAPYAELLTEVQWDRQAWRAGRARQLRAQDPLGPFDGLDLSSWLNRPSDWSTVHPIGSTPGGSDHSR